MDSTKNKRKNEIAHKAARMTQNQLYFLASFLYGTGIILLLSVADKVTAGHSPNWLELAISFTSFLVGEMVARKGEQKK